MKLSGPKFIQYFQPVIDGLGALGSSAKLCVVYAWIAEHHPIPKKEIESTTKGEIRRAVSSAHSMTADYYPSNKSSLTTPLTT